MAGIDGYIYEARRRASSDRLALKIRRDYTRLNLRDLDGSWPTYYEAAGYSIKSEWRVSTSDALLYLLQLLIGANNPPAHEFPEPILSERHLRDMLRLTGPIHTKKLIAAGWDREAAFLSGMRRTVLASRNFQHAQTEQTMQEAAYSAVDRDDREVVQGYLRIAQPTACAFCKRLAGATQKIGLVYDVTAKWRTPHANCRCRLEPQPVYKLLRLRRPEELALTAQMYAALKREADDALRDARRDLIAA